MIVCAGVCLVAGPKKLEKLWEQLTIDRYVEECERSTCEMAKQQNGKAGQWDVRPNPFAGNANGASKVSLADVSRLGLVLDAVLAEGAAVMVGKTRDGGALVLTVLDGDNRHRTYCATTPELEAALESLEAAFVAP